MTQLDQDTLRRRAESNIDARLKFYTNAGSFTVIGAFLLALNWWQAGRITWAVWPLLGMALGLGFQAVHTLFKTNLLRDNMVEREMQKLRNQGR